LAKNANTSLRLGFLATTTFPSAPHDIVRLQVGLADHRVLGLGHPGDEESWMLN
jgi:hypothetical protein